MSSSLEDAAKTRRSGVMLGVSVLLWLLAAVPLLGQPHAEVPIAIPQFGIDLASPTEGPSVPASAILAKPGPTPVFTGAGMGLSDPLDDLDDFSYDRSGALQGSSQFLLLFGVDRESVGGAPPDSSLAATGRIFNVTDQAGRHQAAADLFLTLDAFSLTGYTGRKDGRSRGVNNNTLVANQGDSGGVDQDLSPAKAPVQQQAPAQEIDEADGAAYPSSGSKLRNPTIFFTISQDSPSLSSMPGIPGQQSGADILKDADPTTPANETIYAAAPVIGLLPTALGDDIDALLVLDDGDGYFQAGLDAILFSLARGSPSLDQGPYSPADIFISRGYGIFEPFAAAGNLGLSFIDNVDCLEIIPTNDPAATVFNHAIFLVWPGDYDHNEVLNQIDCSAFLGCYSGPGLPYDTSGWLWHQVLVGPGYVFQPNMMVVETGDHVRWVWMDGPRNVVSGVAGVSDGVFNSGPAVYPPAEFSVAFDEALLNLHPKGGSEYVYFSDPGYTYGMIGSVTVEPHPCAVFDLDFDEDVDCEDWVEFQAVYALANPGDHCPPLSLPDFVSALLGQPNHPAHLCLADLNLDGRADGEDVQAYVFAILGP